MANAKLTHIKIANFKAFGATPQHIDLRPLTVLVGRNSSGKSTIIQTLLLLKQTLLRPDLPAEVPLSLEGLVNALNLSALTHGWPSGDIDQQNGPMVTLGWEATITDLRAALTTGGRPLEGESLAKRTGISWLIKPPKQVRLATQLELHFGQSQGRIFIPSIKLRSTRLSDQGSQENPDIELTFDKTSGAYQVKWQGKSSDTVIGSVEHFLPFVRPTSNAGPYGRARSYAFRALYEQPLFALRDLLIQFAYLGSLRTMPPTLYRPPESLPKDVGVSGESAAQLLYKGQRDLVHYLPLSQIDEQSGLMKWSQQVIARRLVDAVNDCFQSMGLAPTFRLQEVQNVGFQLLYGQAGLEHVGRGIGFLLPVVTAGLFADPLRGEHEEDMQLQEYLKILPSTTHLGLEEPESHTHPKLQTQLAHLFVSWARAGRRMIIETHSDHMVRRLRGMVARTPRGSADERWLLDNVAIIEVEQDTDGVTRLTQAALTPEGGIGERWPADFIEEAPAEEQAISFAGLDKTSPEVVAAADAYLASTSLQTKDL